MTYEVSFDPRQRRRVAPSVPIKEVKVISSIRKSDGVLGRFDLVLWQIDYSGSECLQSSAKVPQILEYGVSTHKADPVFGLFAIVKQILDFPRINSRDTEHQLP